MPAISATDRDILPAGNTGAKDKLGLRVHGLIVGSPDKKRADPAVLRALCSHVLPSGKQEVRQTTKMHFCHIIQCTCTALGAKLKTPDLQMICRQPWYGGMHGS